MKPDIDIAKSVIFKQAIQSSKSVKNLVESYKCPIAQLSLDREQKKIVEDHVSREVEYHKTIVAAEVEDPAVIIDPHGHEDWYDSWMATGPQRYYWNRLKQFVGEKLKEKFGAERAGIVVRSIDQSSDRILERLENPQRRKFKTKGLVLGYVQSGKTANFTAVVSKAVDAGYRLVVVLTGIHDNLRSQTQQRLDCELTGEVEGDSKHVEIPVLDENRWLRLTRGREDFDARIPGRLDVEARYRRPILAVMKKNTRVLGRFISWLKATSPSVKATLPLLLIDDEADQASIDRNYGTGKKASSTNRLIRTVLGHFPKHAYIGYTATPFANVLIDIKSDSKDLGKDLYPRNFIVSLPRPEGYVGADRIFVNGHAKNFVRIVPPAEVAALVPGPKANPALFPRQITPKLEEAILSFCLAGAAMRCRGRGSDPATMLIHTSHRQGSHATMKTVVERFFRSLRERLKHPGERRKLLERFERLWTSDFVPVSRRMSPSKRAERFADLKPELIQFMAQVQLFELNSATEDQLDYTVHPEIKALAIGGNTLSRGLTLEGLVTSFYLRESRQYDTLLQMGRWFGYRHGYEDLTRVYTRFRLAQWFEDLALVEHELRQEIGRYEAEGLTPAQLAVRIRDHRTMKVTAPNKMGAAASVQRSFSGSMGQTIWFPLRNPGKLKKNLRAGNEFVKAIGAGAFSVKKRPSGYLAKGIDGSLVLSFLKDYEFAGPADIGGNAGLDSEALYKYIERLQKKGELASWNVAVVSPKDREASKRVVDFGGLRVTASIRNRREASSLRLGVLSNPDHLRFDRPTIKSDIYNGRGPNEPLLILYYIDKDSKPLRDRKGVSLAPLFEGLEEKEDVLGLVFVFPRSTSEPDSYVGQVL